MKAIDFIASSGQSVMYGAEGNLPYVISNQAFYKQALMLGKDVHSSPNSGGEQNGAQPLAPNLPLNFLKASSEESVHHGWANTSFTTVAGMNTTIWCEHGIPGQGHETYKYGTIAFNRGVAQVARCNELAKQRGRQLRVRCLLYWGGQNDTAYSISKDTVYQWLLDYWNDINREYKKITEQSEDIPIIFTQSGCHTFYRQLFIARNFAAPPDEPTFDLALARLAKEYPSKFILTGAQYHLTYGSARSVHLNSLGYHKAGEKMAQIYKYAILDGKPWKPLAPYRAAWITPHKIKLDFDLMPQCSPLKFSTEIPNPGNQGLGIKAVGGNASQVRIDTVELGSDGQSIIVTINKTFSGTQLSVVNAWDNANLDTYNDPAVAGAVYPRSMGAAGPRSCIRDSDPYRSIWNYNQANYATHFIIPVTFQ